MNMWLRMLKRGVAPVVGWVSPRRRSGGTVAPRASTRGAETTGTLLDGLKHPVWWVVTVLTLLAHGGPVPALVAAFALAERTVADGQTQAGHHARRIQETIVRQGHVDVGQVQADEL